MLIDDIINFTISNIMYIKYYIITEQTKLILNNIK